MPQLNQQKSNDVDLFDESYTYQNKSNRPNAQPDNKTTTKSDIESEEFRRGFAAGVKAKAQQDNQSQESVLDLVHRLKKEVGELRQESEDKDKKFDRQVEKLREECIREYEQLYEKVRGNRESLENFKKDTRNSIWRMNDSERGF